MEKKISKIRKSWAEARAVWDESAIRAHTELPRLHKFAHFCVMVWRSFTRNRCPVRASALAYASLLALIPMLAVVMSITSTFLKKEGEQRIDEFIVKLVANMTPPAVLETNAVSSGTNQVIESEGASSTNAIASEGTLTNSLDNSATNSPQFFFSEDERIVSARKEMARRINGFIQNTRSGALGVTGSILLIFVAISMLSRIEDTFNDIWGVEIGRAHV